MAIDFAGLNARLIPHLRELLPQWFPNGKFRGVEFLIGSIQGEAGESLSFNSVTGIGKDFATGEPFGDPIALYAASRNLAMGEAARQLGADQRPNGSNGSTHIEKVPRGTSEPCLAAPLDFPLPRPHLEHGAPSEFWLYFLAEPGGPVSIVCRYDLPNGKKSFGQYSWRGGKWHGLAYPAPRPLYHLRELLADPTLPVLVVEGEKAAEAATAALTTHAVVTWCGGCNAMKSTDWGPLARRQVVLWPDADEVGRKAMSEIATILVTMGCQIAIIPIEGRQAGWDAADAVAEKEDLPALLARAKSVGSVSPIQRITRANPQRSTGKVLDQDGKVENDGSAFVAWEELGLDRVGGSAPFATAANIQTIAMHHSRYRGRLYWDSFRMRKIWTDETGEREWTEEDTLHTLTWIQRSLKMPKVTKSHVHDGLNAAAMRMKKNSLTQWLENLEWDGIERLPRMMVDVFKAEDTDYTSAVGRCWLVSMVARAFEPGCQVDTMVVLEGGQGAYKSSALNILGGPYYAALPAAFGNRDFLQALDGMWLIEIPDMSGFKGRDIEHVKAIITTRQDRYCRRYAHDAETYARQCVFAATANRDDWNEDETGARRFLPVKVGESIDHDLLRDLRNAYFAEAVYRYRKEEPWWDVPKELATQQQALRRPEDSWEPVVRDAITHILADAETKDKTLITIPQIFEKLLLPLHQQGKSEQMRIARILRDDGWLRKTAWDGKRVSKQWFKPLDG